MKLLKWKLAQWFEKKWWKNYLKNKSSSDYLKWKMAYWKKFLNEIDFTIKNKQTIIDIGCGPAGIFILSNENDSSWTAIDPLLGNYEKLKIFNQKEYSQVVFEKTSFEKYNTKQKYDVVFCLNALNHFIYLEENIFKLKNLLNNKGSLIISIDAHNYTFLKRILSILPLDILHPHQFTSKEYESIFFKCGFKVVQKKKLKKEFVFSYYVYELTKNL